MSSLPALSYVLAHSMVCFEANFEYVRILEHALHKYEQKVVAPVEFIGCNDKAEKAGYIHAPKALCSSIYNAFQVSISVMLSVD